MKMAGRRHAVEEIAAKLSEAHELAAKGRTHREISKALGVSVMTYHRWRKMQHGSSGADDSSKNALLDRGVDLERRMAGKAYKELEDENLRLRLLVADLMLEKLKLEEELRGRREPRLEAAAKKQ
jgi:hypothetical protein